LNLSGAESGKLGKVRAAIEFALGFDALT
jgi:hypothetical protein